MPHKLDIFDYLLQFSNVPVVLDAEALQLLHQNTWTLNFKHSEIIATPHIGEFSQMIGKTIPDIQKHRIQYAVEFAKNYQVTLVLKGTNTLVVSKDGQIYINQSGNQALAKAGSGDVLTGILTQC